MKNLFKGHISVRVNVVDGGDSSGPIPSDYKPPEDQNLQQSSQMVNNCDDMANGWCAVSSARCLQQTKREVSFQDLL